MWEAIKIKKNVKKCWGELKEKKKSKTKQKTEVPPLSEEHGSDILTSGKPEPRVAEPILVWLLGPLSG